MSHYTQEEVKRIAEKFGLWPAFDGQQEKFIDGAELKEELTEFANSISAESAKQQDVWQPIETAPKDGTEILLISAGFGDIGVCYWRDDAVMTGWTWGLEKSFNSAVGWKPLPPKANYKELQDAMIAAMKAEKESEL